MTDFKADLKSFNDIALRVELDEITSHIDEETEWQEAMIKEITKRASKRKIKDLTYSEARSITIPSELDGVTVTFRTTHTDTGVGMGEGPDYVYLVFNDGRVYSWDEVGKARLVSK